MTYRLRYRIRPEGRLFVMVITLNDYRSSQRDGESRMRSEHVKEVKPSSFRAIRLLDDPIPNHRNHYSFASSIRDQHSLLYSAGDLSDASTKTDKEPGNGNKEYMRKKGGGS